MPVSYTHLPTIVLVATLSLGNVLNAGFDQIYNMYNPLVYESIDIIDTFVSVSYTHLDVYKRQTWNGLLPTNSTLWRF